jgi:hypothetical protein
MSSIYQNLIDISVGIVFSCLSIAAIEFVKLLNCYLNTAEQCRIFQTYSGFL